MQVTLHQGTTVSAGTAKWAGGQPGVLVQAFLGTAVGTATCNVYARMYGGPWSLRWTATLSGASDHAEYVLDEPWFEIYGDISAISGGPTATIVAGA